MPKFLLIAGLAAVMAAMLLPATGDQPQFTATSTRAEARMIADLRHLAQAPENIAEYTATIGTPAPHLADLAAVTEQ
jgi:hypothetical protein